MGSKVCIVGGGGREHALAESLIAWGAEVYVNPGNAGTQGEGYLEKEPDRADLYLVGPEGPIIDGLADELAEIHGADRVLSICKETSFLEATKIGAGHFMQRRGIACPPFREVHSPIMAAHRLFGLKAADLVLKADKPAAGRGVILEDDDELAQEKLLAMTKGELFGDAGREVQISNRRHGPEISAYAISDGMNEYIVPFFAQDHKRLHDGDEGPNTGGMGAYADVPETIVNNKQREAVYEIIRSTFAGLREEGYDTKGVIYFGLMFSEENNNEPEVIEYNVRWGDPEAQVILPMMVRAGINVYDLFKAAAARELRPEDFEVSKEKRLGTAALSVCLAADNYPDEPRKGYEIFGLDQDYDDVILHHAATKRQNGRVVTNGGRVAYVTGTGNNLHDAAKNAYSVIGEDGVHFDGMQYRTDIGWQALKSAV